MDCPVIALILLYRVDRFKQIIFTRGVTFQTEKRNYSDIRHFKQM